MHTLPREGLLRSKQVKVGGKVEEKKSFQSYSHCTINVYILYCTRNFDIYAECEQNRRGDIKKDYRNSRVYR
jgi:hypothetical protein